MILRPSLVLCLGCSLTTGCAGENLSAGTTGPETPPATTPTTLATLSAQVDAFAMDRTNLYFTSEDGSLYSVAKSGTGAPVVLGPASTPGSTYTGGLAVDDDSIYWTALGDGMTSGAVLSVPKAGGTPLELAMNQSRPLGIAVDETSVYWADEGGPPPTEGMDSLAPVAAIMSIPKGGGSATVIASGPNAPDALTLDPTGVIWHEAKAIRRVLKSGGATTTLTSAAIGWTSTNLIVSGNALYWGANQGGWSLQTAPLAGGTTTTLSATVTSLAALALSPDNGSLLCNAADGTQVGAIPSAPLGGGTSSTVAAADVVPGANGEVVSFLLVDDNAFYWVESWETPALHVVIKTLAR